MLRSLAEWIAIVVVTCLVGEAATRLAGVRPLTPGAAFWRPHERWGWHHVPDSTDRFVKLDFEREIHINSHGLREREIPYEKPPDVARVLVIGDSAVAGFEVADEEVFTRVAESILKAEGRRIEIVNAGTRGWGTDQSLLFLEDEGLRYHPDLVLYLWTPNDLFDNATVHRPFRVFGKPWFTLDADGRLEPRGIPVPTYPYRANVRVGEDGEAVELPVGARKLALLWLRDVFVCHSSFATWLTSLAVRVPDLTHSVNEAGSSGDATDRPADTGPQSPVFRVSVAMVREMDRVSREAGARFAMLGAEDGPGGAIRAAAGLPELGDLRRLRERTPPGSTLTCVNDPHWNALGHRLYGEALADLLRDPTLGSTPASQPAAPAAATPIGVTSER